MNESTIPDLSDAATLTPATPPTGIQNPQTIQLVVLDQDEPTDQSDATEKTEIELMYDHFKSKDPDNSVIYDHMMMDEIKMVSTHPPNIRSTIAAMYIKNITSRVRLLEGSATSVKYRMSIQFNEPTQIYSFTTGQPPTKQSIRQATAALKRGPKFMSTRVLESFRSFKCSGYVFDLALSQPYHNEVGNPPFTQSWYITHAVGKPQTLSMAMWHNNRYIFDTPITRPQTPVPPQTPGKSQYTTADPNYLPGRDVIDLGVHIEPRMVVFTDEPAIIRDIHRDHETILHASNHYTNNHSFIMQYMNRHYYNHMFDQRQPPHSLIKHKRIAFTQPKRTVINTDAGRAKFLNDITINGLWDLWAHVTVLGLSNKHTQNIYDLVNMRPKTTVRIDMYAAEERYRQSYYNYLARKMYNKLWRDLDKKQRETTHTKYMWEIDIDKQIRSNTCEHISLFNTLIKSVGIYRDKSWPYKSWERLKSIVPMKHPNSINTCNLCGMKALCAHHYQMIDIDDPKALRAAMMKFVSERSLSARSYYCHICGDMLVRNIESVVEIDNGQYTGQNITFDPTVHRIWSGVAGIVHTYIQVSKAMNINVIIKSINTIIKPFIMNEEAQLMKVRTNTSQTIDMALHVYISVYAFAAIIKFISHYPNDIRFNIPTFLKRATHGRPQTQAEGGASRAQPLEQQAQPPRHGVVDTKRLQQLFKIALSLILISKRSALAKTTGITDESLKSLLMSAYRRVVKTQVRRVVVSAPSYSIELDRDSVFKYLTRGRAVPPNKTDIIRYAVNWTDRVVNADGNAHGLEPKLYAEYIKWSRDDMAKYTEQSGKPVEYIKMKDNNDKTAKIRDEYETMLFSPKMEKYEAIDTYFVPINVSSMRKPIHPYYRYCSDGKPHQFDTFMYIDGRGKLIAIAKSELKSWISTPTKNKEWVTFQYVDRRCSVCDVSISDITETVINDKSNKVAKSITSAVDRLLDIDNFYMYYESRCPIGGNHKFNSSGACINNPNSTTYTTSTRPSSVEAKTKTCGMSRQSITGKDSAVYDQWMAEFKQEKSNSMLSWSRYHAVGRSQFNSSSIWSSKQDKWNGEASNWKPSNVQANIAALVRIANVKPEQITTLGMSGAWEYKCILNKSVNPVNNATISIIADAIIRLRDYIHTAVISATRIKNGKDMKLFGQLRDLFGKYTDILKVPAIDTSFYSSRIYHLSFAPIETKSGGLLMHTQLIGVLAHILTTYITQTPPNQQQTSTEFVKYMVSTFIGNEMKQSKPDRFKRSVVVGRLRSRQDGDDEEYEVVDIHDVDTGDDPFSMDDMGFDAGEVFDDGATDV